MNAVLTIALKDLKTFFASVKGAAIFLVFLFLLGLFFNYFIGMFIQGQIEAAQAGGGRGPTLEMLMRAIFSNIHFIMFITIPGITMSMFAGERRTNAIRLLLNSPITSSQIVWGKFLGMTFFMSLILFAAFVYPAFMMAYGNPDVGVILSAYLGIFLLMISQLSFGMWVSSLLSNQFLAFIFTLLGLFLLLIIGWLIENQTSTGVIQSVFKYISSTDHLDAFLKGIISIHHFMYFIVMTGIFVFLSILSIESLRWR